jgi:hypothetical protein
LTSRKSVSRWSKPGDDTFTDAVDGVKRGGIITVEATATKKAAWKREYNGAKSFIRRSDLSMTAPTSPERFQVGDKLTCASPTSTRKPAVWACRSRPAIAEEKSCRTVWFVRSGTPRWAISRRRSEGRPQLI